jgi:predicted house-cleaning noncanonical NTP pyrophosphatase (MazG superfamily)
MKYNKLIRDKIPEIIEKNGQKAIIHIASNDEYKEKLREKLQEEVAEYLKSFEKEELADILEVIYALCEARDVSTDEIEKIRKKKANKRGKFKKRIILDETRET